MSSFVLKILAILTMTIDHLGFLIFNDSIILRIIGRIAMPLFAFQIAIGFKKTRSKLKYIFRIFLLALISEYPNILMFSASPYVHSSLNICFTFTLALVALYFIDLAKDNKFFIIASIFPILFSIFAPIDYGIFCVLLVLIFYFFGENKFKYSLGMLIVAILYYVLKNNSIQFYMLLSLPFLYFYNGKKGPNLKYCLYAFYPLHMLILTLIKFYLNTIKI